MRVAIYGLAVARPTLAYWLRRFGNEPVLSECAWSTGMAARRWGWI